MFLAKMKLKPFQNKKDQTNLRYPTKKQFFFPLKRTAFLSGTSNVFGPSYFEMALIDLAFLHGQQFQVTRHRAYDQTLGYILVSKNSAANFCLSSRRKLIHPSFGRREETQSSTQRDSQHRFPILGLFGQSGYYAKCCSIFLKYATENSFS